MTAYQKGYSNLINRKLITKRRAQKYLERLQPKGIQKQFNDYFKNLKTSEPSGDLETVDDGFRVRIGGYRAIFEIEDYEETDDQGYTGEIVVFKLGPRGDVYKGSKGM